MSRRFGGIFDVAGRRERLAELEALSASPDFWSDQARARSVLKEARLHERTVGTWEGLSEACEEVESALELSDGAGPEEAAEIFEELGTGAALEGAEQECAELETRRLLGEEGDESSAILEINSGAGGTDASDWASMLKRMYLRWAERRGFEVKLVDEQGHDEAGIKSCTLEIDGEYAYGYLKAEIGVHRLVRISPFDAAARRHTAFASVMAYPDIDDDIEIDINPSDLRIDTYRASGAGGQHVNTTDSAVRITHLPTGIVVSCQNERSQHKNKSSAMKVLKARMYQRELEKKQEIFDASRAEQKKIEWGSQIRSYVMQPYRLAKDLRTGHESGNVDRVLDGDLNPFMEAWLAQRAEEAAKGP